MTPRRSDGLHDCDTERREAPLIPEMETGICRVAHFPLPNTREFRLRGAQRRGVRRVDATTREGRLLQDVRSTLLEHVGK